MEEPDRNYRYRTQYYAPKKVPNSLKAPKKNKFKAKKTLAALVLIVLIGGSGGYVLAKHPDATHKIKDDVNTTVDNLVAPPSKPKATVNSLAIATMGQTISGVINDNSNIDMSVNLINLNDNQSEHYGDNDTFQAASTAKILTAEYFLHEVETGNQSLSETVNGSSAQTELQQMIVVSNDDAWEDLNELLGYDNLQDYADATFGINDYQAYNNSLSSGDIATALQQLWQGKVLNQSDTQLLLSYMKQANYREYIVPAVPSDDVIYHKIGLYEDYVNDAAIITHDQQAFVLVIFTNGNGAYNWPARATMMQQITKAALKAYFNES